MPDASVDKMLEMFPDLGKLKNTLFRIMFVVLILEPVLLSKVKTLLNSALPTTSSNQAHRLGIPLQAATARMQRAKRLISSISFQQPAKALSRSPLSQTMAGWMLMEHLETLIFSWQEEAQVICQLALITPLPQEEPHSSRIQRRADITQTPTLKQRSNILIRPAQVRVSEQTLLYTT
ncbi:MAG: hypothetical protein ED554_09220 [Synechococcus sp. YX04-3]|nr:MAG: hypothetical protein ED554_09220 [Synechococcus sp. YX04-3]